MSQNKKLNLQSCSKQELEEIKSATLAEKQELEELKATSEKDWEGSSQEELDSLEAKIVAIDKEIAFRTKSFTQYTPEKGTEKMVHLSIVKGRRFNPMTGKEESIPYIQLFTFPEWQLFKKHFRSLGYSIMAVLHDPYGEAEEFITK